MQVYLNSWTGPLIFYHNSSIGKSYTSDAPATSEYYFYYAKENNLVKILNFSIPDPGIKKVPDLGSGYATLGHWISVMQPDPTDNR